MAVEQHNANLDKVERVRSANIQAVDFYEPDAAKKFTQSLKETGKCIFDFLFSLYK